METGPVPVVRIPCTVSRVRWSLPTLACDRCERPAARVWEAARTAVDIDLERPVLLRVEVSVHRCTACRRHFRAQPPFLRRDAVYGARVVRKAVEAVYRDGMAARRVPDRLARDFWVRPSEKMVRRWCRAYAAGLDATGGYAAWVAETFSGVLCVDEVYQGRLALLLAVDPGAPEGDRLVGYQLLAGTVDQAAVAAFLDRLRAAGIEPAQVVTDGSSLYPAVLARVWPAAAHQLCLFHETRRVAAAVDEVALAVRKRLPHPPPVAPPTLLGRRRLRAPRDDRHDPVSERARWRAAARAAGVVQVHGLRRAGLSLSAIARQTGRNWRTVRAWLREPIPAPAAAPTAVALPTAPASAPPPAPWRDWAEVRRLREDVKRGRAILLRRPEHLSVEEAAQLEALLESPAGAGLRTARAFLLEWYGLWRDGRGQRRPLKEAHARYVRWRANAEYARLAPLRRVQQGVDAERFGRLSQFLRHPTWEATSNGAERGGRRFRHGQRPRYNLRSFAAIDDALKVQAHLAMELATAPPVVLPNRYRRGRRTRTLRVLPAAS